MRNNATPDDRNNNLGFRLVNSPRFRQTAGVYELRPRAQGVDHLAFSRSGPRPDKYNRDRRGW